MAIPTREDIAKMREELRRDLEALDRVERLFAERNGNSRTEGPASRIPPPPSTLPPPPEAAPMTLKELIIEGLKRAGEIGAAPKDLLIFCKNHGYLPTTDQNGSASITTALGRMADGGNVRREDGRYYWIGD